MQLRKLAILLIVSTLFWSVIGYAQEDDATATPGPSKTPAPSETAVPEETPELETETFDALQDESTEFTLRELPRSYTQEDLSVLVGNVQRPNGITYIDDFLFTACNGDWTMYRIDSVTGQTITFVQGIRNAHQMVAEDTESGFNLWIPDFDTDQLMLIDETAAFPQLISRDNLDGPWGIDFIEPGRMLISNLRADNIVVADTVGNVAVAVEGLRAPAGLVVQDEWVYVANNSSARRAIEWFAIDDLDIDDDGNVTTVTDITQPLVTGLQNTSNLVLADDGYLYFTYALGTRGVVGRVNPEECRDGGCSNEQVEIVLFTELTAPLSGLTVTPDMRLFVHTIYRPELYWVELYQ